METPITVIFFGIQGTGKGTQAQLLTEYLDTHTSAETIYMETGQLLRDFMARDGYTNELVRTIVDNGELLPSFMPTYVIGRKLIHDFHGTEHLIFDGAARRPNQTLMLDNMLRMYKRNPYHVVILELPEAVAIERSLGRGRHDDTPELIAKRIAWSKEHLDAVTAQFESYDCHIHRIDGSPSPEEVHKAIVTALHI